MKWRGREQSRNIEDVRGQRTSRSSGSPMGIPIGRSGTGGIQLGGGIGIILLIVMFLFGGGLGSIGDMLGGGPTVNPNDAIVTNPNTSQNTSETELEADLRELVGVVLKDTEDIWTKIFKDYGMQYKIPKLVIYKEGITSGCGYSSSAVGPYYCPADSKVYIDLSFYQELATKFGAKGDFAMAYVVAHEIGHHIQNQLGIMNQMNAIRAQVNQATYNRYSVALELQADYLAGVWARHLHDQDLIDEADLDEAIAAARAVGDDTIQKRTQGRVVPENFTHGTAEQRAEWFARGFKYADLEHSDTFKALGLSN